MTAEFSLRELTEVLVRAADLHEGRFELSAVFTMTIGSFGLNNSGPQPGTLSVLTGIGLMPATAKTATSVDASKVNPAPPVATRARVRKAVSKAKPRE